MDYGRSPFKDRVDDSLNATPAAVEEGIIPDGGT
jgi:chaperonin GroEL (HSP60 family)